MFSHIAQSRIYLWVSKLLERFVARITTAAARVVTGARKFDHITPVLRDLHWLPVRQRIKYKLAMTVYKCLHGLAPTYLVDDCHAISAIAPASDIFGLQTLGHHSCQGRRQHWG